MVNSVRLRKFSFQVKYHVVQVVPSYLGRHAACYMIVNHVIRPLFNEFSPCRVNFCLHLRVTSSNVRVVYGTMVRGRHFSQYQIEVKDQYQRLNVEYMQFIFVKETNTRSRHCGDNGRGVRMLFRGTCGLVG